MGKVIAAAVVFATLGFFIGRLTSPEAQVPREPEAVPAARDPEACEKYQVMYDRLRADYIKLQDDFRDTSAGLSVCAPAPVTAVTPPPPVTSSQSAEAATQDDVQIESGSDVADDDLKSTGTDSSTTTGQELTAILNSIIATESAWKQADTPAKKKKFLDRVKLKNAMKTIDSMPSVTRKDRFYSDLHGSFKGQVKFLEKDRKNGKVSLLVRKPEDTDPPNPRAWLVRVDVDDGLGKVTRQNGGIDMLRTTGVQSSAFSIRSSETSYLQMFYQESTDEFIGNYYEKNNKGAYPKSGTFTLKRQGN